MVSRCSTVTQLNDIAEGVMGEDLASAAKSALGIIRDVHDEYITSVDTDCLYSLVDAIQSEGQLAIFDHLYTDAPDCRVCAALALRLAKYPKPS